MKFARTSAIVLLVFLGLSGIAGGAPMIVSSIWKTRAFMPLNLLQHSPFHSYLIPGFILLVANGLLALWIVRLVIQRRPGYGLWTVLQGCVLMGWLVVECIMLRLVIWPHYLYGAVALLLIVFGFVQRGGYVQTPSQG